MKPEFRSFLSNLSAPVPLGTKLALVLRNSWLKVYRRRSCCGHPGQPGC